MSSCLRNKVILLTGAGGGLGSEMAKQFLEKGARLILTDLHKPEITHEMYRTKGTVVGVFAANLETEEGCREVYEHTRDFSRKIDILVNNAGVAAAGGLLDVPDEKWKQLLNINLYAPIYLSKLFLPDMLSAGSGQIVNISSIAGHVVHQDLTYYSISKFGLRAFGEGLHAEYGKKGIKVTNVYPFFTRTKILDSVQFSDNQKKLPDFMIDEPE